MKLILNLRSGLAPLTLELSGSEEEVLQQVREAIEGNSVLDLTDARGERVIVPASVIGYATVPSRETHPVGFGRV